VGREALCLRPTASAYSAWAEPWVAA
jgi:hypothetical protein